MHTPTPWTLYRLTNGTPTAIRGGIDDSHVLVPKNTLSEEDANFIVHAVNNPDKLVKALEEIVKRIESTKKQQVFNWTLYKNSLIEIAKEALKGLKGE